MRILWVKAGKLLPVDAGGKIRSFNILKHLVRWNDVTLVSFYSGPRDERYEDELQRLFPGAIAIPARLPGKTSLWGRVDYIRGIFSPLPYAVYKHTAAQVRERVMRLLACATFDVAVCDFLAPAQSFTAPSNVPLILFEHNVETILWQRQADYQKNAIRAAMYRFEAAKMLRYEKAAIRKFDHVIAVSDHDGRWFRSFVDDSKVSVVPTGVDTGTYTRDEGAKPSSNLIVFAGSMDWEANIDGVIHFCSTILPIIRAEIPETRFRIVGRNPVGAIRKLASEAVEITGTVDSIVPHLREASVVVVPLRIGGGTRLKILEAMAMGKAIVSTSIGAEGLNVKDGSEIILADRASDFGAAVVRLMRNGEERVLLERNASRMAQQCGWERSARAFQQALVKALNAPEASQAGQGKPGVADRELNEDVLPLKTAGSAIG